MKSLIAGAVIVVYSIVVDQKPILVSPSGPRKVWRCFFNRRLEPRIHLIRRAVRVQSRQYAIASKQFVTLLARLCDGVRDRNDLLPYRRPSDPGPVALSLVNPKLQGRAPTDSAEAVAG